MEEKPGHFDGLFKSLPRIKTRKHLIAFVCLLIFFVVLAYEEREVLRTWIDGALRGYEIFSGDTSIYRVRVTVVDEQDRTVGDADLQSSVGGESLKVASGWEFLVPKQNLPADGVVTFRATVAKSFLAGKKEIALVSDYHPSLQIRVTADTSSIVRGTVIDAKQNPVVQSKVWVEGYPAVLTDENGSFSMPAHAADGQSVKIYISSGHKTSAQYVFAGPDSKTIIFEGS